MKTSWLILLCLLVFFYTLITRAPLAVIYGHFKPAEHDIELVGIEGSLREGGASGLVVHNQTAVRDLHWTLQPWLLLLGRAGFQLAGTGDGVVLDGRVAQTLFGTTLIDDFRASGSVKPLLAAFKMFLPIDGMLGLQAEKLVLKHGLPTTAQGHIELNGLSWKLGREPMSLGDFVADVAPSDQGLAALVKTLRGPLDVSGDAQLLADSSYEMHLQIKAKADAPPPLVNMLAGLGAPDNQGYYHIRRKGQLASPAAPVVQAVEGASE
ncbi:MAG: type secretion system protein [Hydrocarboniphaga sp.]|uniref:type II secretion system protein N n=1 Tax=Hydrocarboniphaga sp. TaxID=2033016 RepID=UPI00260F73E6|nr:type II secretion system protein N [Hydrocarboniphaga sp.]MDB5968072.1 type secretion system protein [Hydrocarboniphaga sp.]